MSGPVRDQFIAQVGLGPAAVSGLCECYSSNFNAWWGGLPDLLCWRAASSTTSADSDASSHCEVAATAGYEAFEVALIEVKGPNDSLSCRQHAWIDKLVSWSTQPGAALSVVVCYVTAQQQPGE